MSEEEMIQAINGGERQQEVALEALYRKAAEFRRHFQYKGLSLQVAEDLVQETIVKVFRNASGFTGGAGFGAVSANAWLWGIAKNTMYDYLRAQKGNAVSLDDDRLSDTVRRELEVEMASKNPHGLTAQTTQDCVSNGIEEFAAEYPDRARVLEMQLDGQAIASIAHSIGRTVAATKEYLSQCKKKLAPFIHHCTELLQA